MKIARLALIGFAVLLSASVLAVPEILIVQGSEKLKDGFVSVDLTDALAQEFDSGGKVSPIVWSLGDPIFRAAVGDGVLKSPPEHPSLRQAQESQRKLKVEYLLIATVHQEGDQIKGAIDLYRGGKEIWRDDKVMSVALSGAFDRDSSVKSLARTWSEMMDTGALRDLATRPVHPTPDPLPGSVAKPPDVVTPAAPQGDDDKKLFADAETLFTAGQVAEGVTILRDSIDAKPADLARRRELVAYLMKANKPDLAAIEARRASQLSPNDVEFRMAAAKGWLAAGKPDEAQLDLNEIVARDPKGTEARELLGEAALWQLNASAAIDHFDAAIKEKATPESYLYRSLAKAIGGDLEGSSSDLDASTGLDPASATPRYAFCVLVLDKAASQFGDEIKPLFDAAVAKPGKDVSDGVAYQNRRIAGCLAVLSKLDVPPIHAKSHDRRILALKLLSQSLSDLAGYLDTPTEDALTDARINLGEALKQLDAAKQVYEAEVRDQPASE